MNIRDLDVPSLELVKQKEPRGILDLLQPEVVDRLQSRREALSRAGVWSAGMALASIPLGLGVLAKSAFAQDGLPQQVRDILNFALTLEYLEAEFYTLGLGANGLIPAEHVPIFDQIRIHEDAHVALLLSVLGSAAVEKPTFDFTAGGQFAPFQEFRSLPGVWTVPGSGAGFRRHGRPRIQGWRGGAEWGPRPA
ncbi:MAG: ferritin-like domain-containing protein [Gemmatimonadota bacterium]